MEICIAYHQQTIDTQHHVIDFSRSFMVQTPAGSFNAEPKEKTGKYEEAQSNRTG